MDGSTAEALALKLVREASTAEDSDPFNAKEARGYTEEVAWGLARLAEERLPSGAISAVIGRHGEIPWLAALDAESRTLYLARPVRYDPDVRQPVACCQVLPISRDRVTLGFEQTSGDGTQRKYERTEWHFVINGVELDFSTDSAVDVERTPAELLALELCRAAGMPLRNDGAVRLVQAG